MPRDVRHTRLMNYSFKCGCEACRADWPTSKLLADEPQWAPEALVTAVKTLLERTRSSDGQGVHLEYVAREDTAALCQSLQNLYFAPTKRSRLDKLYRALELLLYYHFCSKTVKFTFES
jgi:hypothetical protein